MSYTPTEVDIQWARNVVQTLKQDGALAYPASGLIYRLDKANKRMVLQNPSLLAECYASYVTHQMTIDVFACIGYQVTELETECHEQ